MTVARAALNLMSAQARIKAKEITRIMPMAEKRKKIITDPLRLKDVITL